ncbi:MAG: glycosyltransferase family 2 protein [Pseudomonadales bacterium]|nr:glycosyltransferase family 2 protein [Pseudomonadales bacterium]
MAKTATKLPASVWIVMPGLNESRYVRTVLKKVKNYTDNIIFVDDGSTDDTVEQAEKEITHVLHHKINLGKGAALKTGCDYAFNELGANTVIMMDSDDQHNPAELPKFIEAMKSAKAEVVFGARKVDGQMPFFKRMMNKCASMSIKLLFGGQFIPDIPSGYKALSKKAYPKLRWDSLGYQVEMEIASRVSRYKIPFTSITIDTIYHDHDKGMTFLNTLDLFHSILWWRITL